MDYSQAIQEQINYLIWTIRMSIDEVNNIPKVAKRYDLTFEHLISESADILSDRLEYAIKLGKVKE